MQWRGSMPQVLCVWLSATGCNSAITAEIIMFFFSHVRLMMVQYSIKSQDLYLSYSFQLKIDDNYTMWRYIIHGREKYA